MNERIEQLAQQCTEYITGTLNGDFEKFDYKKFAELLIRECAAKAWWAEQYDMGDGKPISKQITEHFGVEE
jgi:hypothetical protein